MAHHRTGGAAQDRQGKNQKNQKNQKKKKTKSISPGKDRSRVRGSKFQRLSDSPGNDSISSTG